MIREINLVKLTHGTYKEFDRIRAGTDKTHIAFRVYRTGLEGLPKLKQSKAESEIWYIIGTPSCNEKTDGRLHFRKTILKTIDKEMAFRTWQNIKNGYEYLRYIVPARKKQKKGEKK
jgi:hypothetical protein